MKKNRMFIFGIILLAASLLLSACGGSAASGGNTTQLNVKMSEFAFDPTTFTVPAGAKVNLTLTNTGSVTHSFVIMKQGTKASTPFSASDQSNIYWSTNVDAGKTANVSFTAPSQPGNYEVVCDIAGHLEAGMQATLTVTQ